MLNCSQVAVDFFPTFLFSAFAFLFIRLRFFWLISTFTGSMEHQSQANSMILLFWLYFQGKPDNPFSVIPYSLQFLTPFILDPSYFRPPIPNSAPLIFVHPSWKINLHLYFSCLCFISISIWFATKDMHRNPFSYHTSMIRSTNT